jgi:hypothetical protein
MFRRGAERHPGSVNPRRLAVLVVGFLSAAAVGLAMPRIMRPHEPTVVPPIILVLESRGPEVRTDNTEPKKRSAHGAAMKGADSFAARPVQPPPPPPAGDDDQAGDDERD